VAWTKLSHALETFTTYDPPGRVHLLLYEGGDVRGEAFGGLLAPIAARFGQRTSRQAVSGAVSLREHRWSLREEEIQEALALLRAIEPLPRQERLPSAISVRVEATFLMRDPETGRVLEQQAPALYGAQEASPGRMLGQSFVSLSLGAPSTCSLFLSLPYPDVTPEVTAYARTLDESLPFRLSRKHWSRWALNKAGTRYHPRRVDVFTQESEE